MERIKVKNIKNLITQQVSVAHEDDNLLEVAEKIIEDPKTRSVYILDDRERLVGIIPVIELVQYLYCKYIPEEYISYHFPLKLSGEPKARDIMLPPVYVRDDDTLEVAFKKMFKNSLEELPVVDENMHVIGDLNILELIRAWVEVNKHAR